MSTPEPAPRRATVKDAVSYSGIPEGTLRRWIAEGILPATKVGPKRIEVDLNDLDRLRRPRPTTTTPEQGSTELWRKPPPPRPRL